MKNEKTYELVLTALFTAIIVIMAFTPLGYIPLIVINATISRLSLERYFSDRRKVHF